LRVAQFLRQTTLIPRVLSKLITELHKVRARERLVGLARKSQVTLLSYKTSVHEQLQC